MRKITLISVPVKDQQQSKEFYKKLGFEVVVEAPMGENQTWVQLGLPGNEVTITLVNWFPAMQPGSLQGLIIQTDDIKALSAELEGKGIKVGKIDQTPWGQFAPVTDPDGNGLTLHQE